MNTRYSLGSGALIAALLSSTASFAEVTPRQVWENWRGYLESSGYQVTAQEAPNGAGLSVTGLSMTAQLPDDSGTITMAMPDMTFTDNGDGSVSIKLPDTAPLTMQLRPPSEVGGEAVDIGFTYSLPGFSMNAAGSPEDLQYSYAGDQVSLQLSSLVVDGQALDIAKFQLELSGVSGDMRIKAGNLRMIEQNTIASGGMRYEISVTDPEGSGAFSLRGRNSRVSMSASMALPMEYDPTDLAAALKSGMAIDATMSFGTGAMEYSFSGDGQSASGSSSTGASSYSMAMSADKLDFGFSLQDLTAALTSSDIPLPINYTAGELAMRIAMPASKSDTPGDIIALLKLVDFAPDDMIWSMFDPTGALPHDPATLIVDLSGKANWLFDIFDPASAEAMERADMPAELRSLTLNQLKVSAAGAELTGSGSFVFDNDDLRTFDGMPAPDGSVDLKLVGANGLLDRLIAMGLMSEDDAMGARMMMGLFGRPGEGEDEVLSTIEVKSDGQILANGQRLQ